MGLLGADDAQVGRPGRGAGTTVSSNNAGTADLGLPPMGEPRFASLDESADRPGRGEVPGRRLHQRRGLTWPTGWPKPVLVEGPAGTGKTQLAKSVAELTGARLIRLQCYEGLDEAKVLYEWNYRKQLLRIQAGEHGKNETEGPSWKELEDDIFSEDLPTHAARCWRRSEATEPVILLIDEVDRVELRGPRRCCAEDPERVPGVDP